MGVAQFRDRDDDLLGLFSEEISVRVQGLRPSEYHYLTDRNDWAYAIRPYHPIIWGLCNTQLLTETFEGVWSSSELQLFLAGSIRHPPE